MTIYYVYAYLRNDRSPYYIGKGSGSRIFTKSKGEVGKPTKDRMIIIENNLTTVGALALERRLIRWYGRKDLGTGILRNKTNGGDGGSGAKKGNILSNITREKISKAKLGIKRKPMSKESKKKLSESMKGKNLSKVRTLEQREAISRRQIGRKGKPHTEETKQKLREINLGKVLGPISDEHRKRISQALTGKIRSKEHCDNLSKSLKGREPNIRERKAYLKAMETGKTKCEYCGYITTLGNYRRWHGINCKTQPDGRRPNA